jgi:hypothetical protein
MAYFAKIDDKNTVTAMHVVNNQVILDSEGNESELIGQQFLNSLYGTANWIQTSYNGNFRKQYAGVGFYYHKGYDIFIAPQPYQSWALDSNYDWQPPTPYPTDGNFYDWNEETLTWDLITLE